MIFSKMNLVSYLLLKVKKCYLQPLFNDIKKYIIYRVDYFNILWLIIRFVDNQLKDKLLRVVLIVE